MSPSISSTSIRPFNSNATYNVLFREHDSSESATPPRQRRVQGRPERML